jgi:hypothetical protein
MENIIVVSGLGVEYAEVEGIILISEDYFKSLVMK